jgi:subtilisin family serine protease
MNVGPAWQKGYTGKGVVVSILDDGIQRNHPDLDKNYVSSLFEMFSFVFLLSPKLLTPTSEHEGEKKALTDILVNRNRHARMQ